MGQQSTVAVNNSWRFYIINVKKTWQFKTVCKDDPS